MSWQKREARGMFLYVVEVKKLVVFGALQKKREGTTVMAVSYLKQAAKIALALLKFEFSNTLVEFGPCCGEAAQTTPCAKA
ncbi:MAG: hypothetical protein M3247_08900 [Thermoproteota archaeon]|nr:hypothetical protein [Thermoproteota archaeon]